MTERFPSIDPHASGMLDVGDGHTLHWEVSGNPVGRAALYLHGGPGAGASPGARRYFDPRVWRIVVFDQRGCGRSRPHDAPLATLDTARSIADIERLRVHLGIERWTILGVSWGTTLALAYAHAHRDRVESMVLALVTTTSRAEVAWITEGVSVIFPREHRRFVDAIPAGLRHLRIVDAYATLLTDADPFVRAAAARAWCDWEDAHVSLSPGHAPSAFFDDAERREVFARQVTHFWRHAAFLDDSLLRDAARLDGIRAVLIHGRHDVSSPLGTALALHEAWSTSRLVVLDDCGHGNDGSFPRAIVEALQSRA
jgi:proline iminopeptidase